MTRTDDDDDDVHKAIEKVRKISDVSVKYDHSHRSVDSIARIRL
jgi:hypothetical protein